MCAKVSFVVNVFELLLRTPCIKYSIQSDVSIVMYTVLPSRRQMSHTKKMAVPPNSNSFHEIDHLIFIRHHFLGNVHLHEVYCFELGAMLVRAQFVV